MRIDPGIGKAAAPIGSVEWAQYVRLHMQTAVKDLEKAPGRVKEYVDLVLEHRGWTLMNRPDGSFFGTWEEFCGSALPWGLGKPWGEIRAVLEAAHGKKAVQLGTVAPAKSPPGKASIETLTHGADNRPEGGLLNPRQAEKLRAIAERAPHQVKELFRQDLIGVAEAAKLGPKNPTPDEAAGVTKVAIAAADVVKAAPKPETPRAKRELQRKVNATVRQLLGVERDPIAKALSVVRALDERQLTVFCGELAAFCRPQLESALKGAA